tara:strand:- start:97 stop:471 length:375 start_codon:yes stop_codon:yes gene_type:complete
MLLITPNFIMRLIEKQMNFALSNKTNWRKDNTQVVYNESTNCSSVYLHGHQIATLDHNTQAIKLDSCGYQTVTTKSRLNAILDEVKYGAKVYQKNWNWFVSFRQSKTSFFDGIVLFNEDKLVFA